METMEEKKIVKILIGIGGGEKRKIHFHKDYGCEILMLEARGGSILETSVDLRENDPFFCRECFSELFK